MPQSSAEPRRFPAWILALTLAIVGGTMGAGPADPLFQLVPPDAALTLSMEDLRGHVREVLGSPVFRGLSELPAVRHWLRSDESRGFRAAVDRVERLLETRLDRLRDDLLGEAVVLTLQLPAGAGPEEARGLLLARVPDVRLLDRLIQTANASQSRDGTLVRVSTRTHGKTAYRRREFREGERPDEFYAKLADRVFAWSNSEAMIQEVIDRQSRGMPGLTANPAFQEARAGLPDRALIRLHVDPRFVERVLSAAPPPEKPEDRRFLEAFQRYLSGLRHAAAALCWEGAPVLHVEERFDPEKVPTTLRRWAAREADVDSTLRRVPSTAIAVATAHLDLNALTDAFLAASLEKNAVDLDALWTAGRGIALGLDPRDQIFPHLGPWASAHVERPSGTGEPTDAPREVTRLPVVVSFQIARTAEGSRAAAAVDNALRTLLALNALDPKHSAAGPRLETRSEGGATITSLSGVPAFAFAVTEGRLILGSSSAAVARALVAQADPHASERFDRLRELDKTEASSFACVDLRALHDFANPRRAALAQLLAQRQNRPVEETGRDLDQALSLIEPFEAVSLSSSIAPDFSRAHRTLRLIPRETSRDQAP